MAWVKSFAGTVLSSPVMQDYRLEFGRSLAKATHLLGPIC